jgi:SAM-dependent methyltransferase
MTGEQIRDELRQAAAALAEAARVLRPGGVLGTVTWGRNRGSEAGRIWGEILTAQGVPADEPTVDNHALVDQPAKLRALALAAGLEPLDAWASAHEERHDLEGWLAGEGGASLSRRPGPVDLRLRERCLRAARTRMAALPREAFLVRSEVVYSLARRRPSGNNG